MPVIYFDFKNPFFQGFKIEIAATAERGQRFETHLLAVPKLKL